ncbi:hypothetical protein GCM10023321_73510 [Pseudonocardia eucalypti]|uniref:HTH tetR-type domain-containing protein n=1 Tax=Pseudonocardia eucalypti TaxID=648755 RepID=A0ABP9R920_9PSEU|nr:AcrR family transcriptional regulator [Pseudonocardia eucalypti]
MTTGGAEDLRSRTRRAVRAEIATVALELFLRNGFERTTVDEIAAAAGLSRRSFFRYFPTKEDTVLGFVLELGQQLADAVAARPAAEDPWTALRAAFAVPLAGFDARPDDVRALLRLIHGTPALRARQQDKQDHWRRLLGEALRERVASPLEADVLVVTALGAFDVMCRHWLDAQRPDAPGELLDRLFAMVGPRRRMSVLNQSLEQSR